MEAVEAPGVGAFGGDLALGAGQEEVGGGAAAGGLDLDQAFAARRVEAADVVAGAVAAFLRRPFDLARQVGAVVGDQEGVFVAEDVFFAPLAEGAVAVVAGGGVVFADDAGEALWPGFAGRAERRRGGDGEEASRDEGPEWQMWRRPLHRVACPRVRLRRSPGAVPLTMEWGGKRGGGF